MPVPGPIKEVGVVTVAVTATRKIPAEAGTEARVVRASPVPDAPSPATERVASEDVREVSAKIAERLERYLKDSGRDVEYRVDADAGATVITVRRSDTGEVVRQFPTEEALAWMRRLNEQSGTFVDALA
jgi:flagellar protein FlaG